MVYFLFFSIPYWVILAIIFLAVGFLGLSVDWIASHSLWILLGIIALCILWVFFFEEKNKRLWVISVLSVFTGTLTTFMGYLLEIAERFDEGMLLNPIFLAVGGVIIVFILFLLSYCLVIRQINCSDQDERDKQIPWNFIIRMPLTMIPIYLQVTYSLLW